MKKKSKGYYETGFDPEPFTIEAPSPISPEKRAELKQWRLAQVWDNLKGQGALEPTPGESIWDNYFSNPDRPSIAQVLLLCKTLSPKRG